MLLLCTCIGALPCGSNRAFVDLGANDGQSLAWFERNLLRSSASTSPYTSVTAFEMNPHFQEPLRVKLLGLLVVSDDEMRVVMSYRQEMLHDPILGTSRRRQTVHEAERFMSYVLRQRAKTLWKIHDPISYRACGELPRNIGGYGSRRLCVWHMNRVRRDAMMSFYTRLAIASKLAQIKEAATEVSASILR